MFELTSYGFNTALIVCLIAITIGVLYYVFIPLYIWKGQTPGKKICKIKVIDYDHKDVTMKNMMLRELLGATLLEGGITYYSCLFKKDSLSSTIHFYCESFDLWGLCINTCFYWICLLPERYTLFP